MVQNEIAINTLTDRESCRWDDYVRTHESGTFFHLAGWMEILGRVFGHKTFYLYAQTGTEIVGVLPLGNIKSFLFGNSLSSVPFCVYGGVLCNTPEIGDLLEAEARKIANDLRVDSLELKNTIKNENGLPTKELYVTFKKEIDPDPDVNMKNIPRKQRAMVRKGIKAGMNPVWDNNLNVFYNTYALSVKSHGTPVFPKKYFMALLEVFKSDCKILNVYKDNIPVSTVMVFYFRNEALPYYGGGTPEARRLKAFDYMYWEVMQDACRQGLGIFDYGRSKKGTGSYSFKKNWGFEPQQLYYQYYLIKAEKIPEINPLNPKYRLFIAAWKKLPLFVTKMIGPLLSRNLG